MVRPRLFGNSLRRLGAALSLTVLALTGMTQSAHAVSRIKDMADFEGVRDNLLVGYGLVVGLNSTGDNFGRCLHPGFVDRHVGATGRLYPRPDQ